jgi:hypothetical protein
MQVGDVIYIEANSGAVKRVGRCDAYATEFDLEAEEYVPLPKVRDMGLDAASANQAIGFWSTGLGGAEDEGKMFFLQLVCFSFPGYTCLVRVSKYVRNTAEERGLGQY